MDVDYHDYPCHTLYSAHKVKRVGEIYHVTHVDNHVTLVLVYSDSLMHSITHDAHTHILTPRNKIHCKSVFRKPLN